MNTLRNRIRLSLAALIVAAVLAVAPATASAQVIVQNYYAPPPLIGPTVTYYSPSTATYYAAPVVTYVPARTYTYSFYQPVVAYYPAPVVTYAAPAAVYVPSVTTTTYYRRGLIFPRVYANTTVNYYTPAFFRY